MQLPCLASFCRTQEKTSLWYTRFEAFRYKGSKKWLLLFWAVQQLEQGEVCVTESSGMCHSLGLVPGQQEHWWRWRRFCSCRGSGCMAGLSHFTQLLLFQLKAPFFSLSTAELTQGVCDTFITTDTSSVFLLQSCSLWAPPHFSVFQVFKFLRSARI